MRIKHKSNLVVSVDTAGKDKLYAPDDALAEVVLDGFQEVASGTANLLAAAPLTLPMAGLTDARGVFIKASGDFSLVINGGAPLSVQRGHTAAAGVRATSARVFLECGVTSVVVTAGASAITVTWALWGDPLA